MTVLDVEAHFFALAVVGVVLVMCAIGGGVYVLRKRRSQVDAGYRQPPHALLGSGGVTPSPISTPPLAPRSTANPLYQGDDVGVSRDSLVLKQAMQQAEIHRQDTRRQHEPEVHRKDTKREPEHVAAGAGGNNGDTIINITDSQTDSAPTTRPATTYEATELQPEQPQSAEALKEQRLLRVKTMREAREKRRREEEEALTSALSVLDTLPDDS